MSNLPTPADEWLREQFEHEYCAECHGDERDHDAIPFLGNWFARCHVDAVDRRDDDAVMADHLRYMHDTAVNESLADMLARHREYHDSADNGMPWSNPHPRDDWSVA